MRRILCGCFAIFIFLTLPSSGADSVGDRLRLWESSVFLCYATPGGLRTPSKRDPGDRCDDGDMTLFNGLLCWAGDERGCVGVAEAMAASGEWHRSPRIRYLGKNDRGNSNFSPDMALGVELYLLKKRDISRAEKWLLWIDGNVPCAVEIGGRCIVRGLPRFCTDNDGCTIRLGDAAVLSAVVDRLQRENGLRPLPDGPLRAHLGSLAGYGPLISLVDSHVNEPGFPQHLVGVALVILRESGIDDYRLNNAAKRLFEKNKGNAFFAYVALGATREVEELTLKKCPGDLAQLREPLNQWQWEREETDHAWEHSCLWDCIFMAHLLGRHP